MQLSFFQNIEPAGLIVICIILFLFVLATILLFTVSARYSRLQRDITQHSASPRSDFALTLRDDFSEAYCRFGKDTNTPSIVDNVISVKLHIWLFFERFINNAVSLFVTIGLFGTFLGLALSVGSLTELLGTGNSSEWLNLLDNVGSGLFSALSGMGIAFYTSLVGVACSIVFTILRAIANPAAQRRQLETTAELWLDHTVSASIQEAAPHDDAARLITLKKELRQHAIAVTNALNAATEQMNSALSEATKSLNATIEYSKEPIRAFHSTVQTFNDNVRDFGSINYDLRGSIERMDIAARDLSTALRHAGRSIGNTGCEGERK